jgi:hypothetical protein
VREGACTRPSNKAHNPLKTKRRCDAAPWGQVQPACRSRATCPQTVPGAYAARTRGRAACMLPVFR